VLAEPSNSVILLNRRHPGCAGPLVQHNIKAGIA
jgi:hypothetical protein